MRALEGVRDLRERRMLTQQELADRAAVSLFTVQRIERGEGSVRPKTGRAIAGALGVGVEDLLGKAQAPLWLEERPERREEVYEPWGEFLNQLARRWEQKVARGDFDLSAINEFASTLTDLSPMLVRLGKKEKQEQPEGYPDTFGPIMGAGISRVVDVMNPLIGAEHEKQAGGAEVINLEEARKALSGSVDRAAV